MPAHQIDEACGCRGRNEIDEEFQLEIGGLRDKAETVVQELMQPSLADWIDPDSTPALVPVDWHAPLAEDTVHVLIGKLTGGNLQASLCSRCITSLHACICLVNRGVIRASAAHGLLRYSAGACLC